MFTKYVYNIFKKKIKKIKKIKIKLKNIKYLNLK